MAISIVDAAILLGVSEDHVRDMQKHGDIPDPIPDDYLDPVVKFRLDLMAAHVRRMDRLRDESAPNG